MLVLAVAIRLAFDLFLTPRDIYSLVGASRDARSPFACSSACRSNAPFRATGTRPDPSPGANPAASPRGIQVTQPPTPEDIQIGLSTDVVAITADFSGADLTIFGSVENADPQVNRQGRYDVIVVLRGQGARSWCGARNACSASG